ncbi:hypothetical protein KMZ93_16240 [Bradyrhizobium sediminis]|uniref:Uncharacterized protein n=1 Tax=Bradyrhizobium sediminis TaxID=2840469 RepID=A0A975NVL3_9BRAD|nr:hypothetical protein [Bradyrhizobium sediminis]QWG21551.1 hypothetical protein KMZ93_16240 [Bradyrhizobium sediminis]
MGSKGIAIASSTVLFLHSAYPLVASDYYKASVTRKSQDLYEVVGQNTYVKTRYCYEYVYYSDAILKIDAPSGYTVGEIIFVGNGGNKCEIEKLLR